MMVVARYPRRSAFFAMVKLRDPPHVKVGANDHSRVASAGTLLLLVTRNQPGFESKHLWVVASIATLAAAPFRT